MRIERPIDLPSLVDILAKKRGSRRFVGIAGPPASGKSHTADLLCEMMNARGVASAVLPLDGFHYDDMVLTARGLLPRKGAPETFDVAGFAAILRRLRRNEEPEVAVPVFDRALEISRAGARIIPSDAELLIVEGNYLLLEDPRWASVCDHFDITIRVSASEDLLRERLMKRWRDADLPPETVRRKVEENDLPNCRLVLNSSRPADFVIEA